MVDYDFYANVYLGSAISEKMFPSLAAQAASILSDYERRYTVSSSGENSRNMAICAMAECLQAHHRAARHTGASVGSVSVSYRQERVPLARQLYQKASIYLDIYRGVS